MKIIVEAYAIGVFCQEESPLLANVPCNRLEPKDSAKTTGLFERLFYTVVGPISTEYPIGS